MLVLYAALGGGVGAALRFLVSSKVTHILGAAFPYGTMVVNVLGSFIMGALVEWLVKTLPHSNELRTFLAVGLLGGFTTFSAFSLDAVGLYDQGNMASLLVYVVGSVLFAIIALVAGMWLMRSVIT
jgi:CrcB protein